MSVFLLLWFLFAAALENLVGAQSGELINPLKKVLYYLAILPYFLVAVASEVLRSHYWAMQIREWFKS